MFTDETILVPEPDFHETTGADHDVLEPDEFIFVQRSFARLPIQDFKSQWDAHVKSRTTARDA